MQRTSNRVSLGAGLAAMILVVACGGAASPTPTPVATTAVVPTAGPTQGPIVSDAPVVTQGPTGPANLDAAPGVGAGSQFDVTWTGPNGQSDFVAIVELGATKWTDEDYFNTNGGSPQKLNAPTKAGDYELWYVAGGTNAILFRKPIKVLSFVGSLDAPASVEANKEFDVAWTGPAGQGDYITIVKLGATQWTSEDYFNANGSPQKLLAPVQAGPYEIWYVTGSDHVIQIRRSILITATSATVQAPPEVAKGGSFQVEWTGPNGPSDYVTIVPAGSPPQTYLSYFNTNSGSPGTLTAPTTTGNYEVWYVAGQDSTVLATDPMRVR